MTHGGGEEEGVMEGKEEEAAPAHHPPAPPSELFNISTTIDPSYIISLIRKLLPHGTNSSVHGSEHCMEQHKDSNSDHGVPNRGGDGSGSMETLGELDRFSGDREFSVDGHGEKVNHELLEVGNCENDYGVDEMADHGCGFSRDDLENHGVSTKGDQWEESGCILWDLSANEGHAEFMVENLLLEVLLANLNASESVRVKEICLGIIGNLACHEVPRNAITSNKGLIQTVTDQLFLDDSVCLSETCRLLTSVLPGSGSVNWGVALVPEHILCRIIWIAENTLNTQLLIKCLELLLAILDNQDVVHILLPPLMKLDLPIVLRNLLACEMGSFTVGREPERCSALEMILCVIESLSTIDNYSRVICSDDELLRLVCSVVKLPDKVEVASSCITAVVLIANILTDEPTFVTYVSQDLSFLQGLLDVLPFVSDDSQARGALWSVLARVLVQVEVDSMSQSSLQQYGSVLIDKSELIEEDLDSHKLEDSTDDNGISNISRKQSDSMVTSLRRILDILQRWVIRSDASDREIMEDNDGDHGARVHRLLHYCRKHIM
ncbi:hypothetical protein AAC387_Pa11g1038 [Persea americana]